MADIRAGAVNQQVVTVKDFQRLMDLFTLNFIKTIDGIFQKYGVETHIGLPARKDFDNQEVMLLEEEKSSTMEKKENATEVFQADILTYMIEQQDDFILHDTFGNKLWIYKQSIGLIEYNSKKSLKGTFNLKISSRRDRAFQLSQPQIYNFKSSKIKLGEGLILKELMKKKDWKKYRKKGILD